MRRITKKPWFGAKRYVGWGWSVSTVQGRIVTALFALLVLLSALIWRGSSGPAIVGLVLVYLLVIVLTGDTPGGPDRSSGGSGPAGDDRSR